MGVLINPERPGKVREFRDVRRFAAALEAEAARPGRRRAPIQVVIMIQVRNSKLDPWTDLVEFWSGRWSGSDSLDIPRPTKRDLVAAGRSVSARYARGVVRTTI